MHASLFVQICFVGHVISKTHGSARLETHVPNRGPLISIPEPEITVNHSSNFWKGMEWHYRITEPESGEVEEEFSIHIMDDGFVTEGGLSLRSTINLDTVSLQPRDNWVCEYVYACMENVVYAAAVSQNQITAAAVALGTYLREDGYANSKSIAKGFISQTAVGLFTGITGWYITNKIQGQNSGATDTCASLDISNLENMIAQLQADIQDMGHRIQAGNSNPIAYERYSEDTNAGQDGAKLVHTCKPTTDSNDYKTISSCNFP